MRARAPFHFDRSWRFDVPVDTLWEALADTSSYPAIWPWLRGFDAGPLAPGSIARFRVQPPLPYSLHFVVTVDQVVRAERIDTTIGGDVQGWARLVVSPTADGGAQARITWELEVVRPALTRIERIARPAMVWGHDRVVSLGVRQFTRRALER